MKASAAVVALLILAALSTGSSDPGMTPGLLFGAAIAVAVSAVSYREGYNAGQRDCTEHRNRRTRPRWRRWLGYAAIAVPNVFVWALLVWATRYDGAASWLFVLAGVLAVASIGVGAWVVELLLFRPFHYAQSHARRASAPKNK